MSAAEVAQATYRLDSLRTQVASAESMTLVRHLNDLLIHFAGESRITKASEGIDTSSSPSGGYGIVAVTIPWVMNAALSVLLIFLGFRVRQLTKNLRLARGQVQLGENDEADNTFAV